LYSDSGIVAEINQQGLSFTVLFRSLFTNHLSIRRRSELLSASLKINVLNTTT